MFKFRNDGRYAKMENYKILNSNEELLNAFIEVLEELKQAFKSLIQEEMDLDIKKDFEIMNSIISQK